MVERGDAQYEEDVKLREHMLDFHRLPSVRPPEYQILSTYKAQHQRVHDDWGTPVEEEFQ
jgi:hypothetical protein